MSNFVVNSYSYAAALVDPQWQTSISSNATGVTYSGSDKIVSLVSVNNAGILSNVTDSIKVAVNNGDEFTIGLSYLTDLQGVTDSDALLNSFLANTAAGGCGYAITVTGGGDAQFKNCHNNTLGTSTWSDDDTFSVAISGGTVVYKQNDATKFTETGESGSGFIGGMYGSQGGSTATYTIS